MRKKIILSMNIMFVTLLANAQLVPLNTTIDFEDQIATSYYTPGAAPNTNIFQDINIGTDGDASETYAPGALGNLSVTQILDDGGDLKLKTELINITGSGTGATLLSPGFAGGLTVGVEYKFNFKIKGNTGSVSVSIDNYDDKWDKMDKALTPATCSGCTVQNDNDGNPVKLTSISTEAAAEVTFTLPADVLRVRLSLYHFIGNGATSSFTIDDLVLTPTATANRNEVSNSTTSLTSNFIENSIKLESTIDISKVALLSMTGSILNLSEISKNNYDASSIPSGIYILKTITIDGNTQSYKIIKK